jgi:molybdopterin-guanine dinucleotide biosynthesis protein A
MQPVVVVLACDMPLITRANIDLLVDTLDDQDADAVMFVSDGRRQPLPAAYRATALTQALRALDDPNGESVRHLIRPLTVHEIAADPGTTADCDTWADVARTRELLED